MLEGTTMIGMLPMLLLPCSAASPTLLQHLELWDHSICTDQKAVDDFVSE